MTLLLFTMIAFPINHSIAGMASIFTWTIPEINVCFAEKETEFFVKGMKTKKRDWRPREKRRLQRILETEFSVDRTGYTFVGFKDCKDTKNINVVVVGVARGLSKQTLSGVEGVATVGMKRNRITSYERAHGAVLLSPLGIRKMTIVHEFGHILGLMHEHDHPEAPLVSACPYYFGKSESQSSHSIIFTDFDKKSVMNYCHVLFRGINQGLSPNDQELILDLYRSGVVTRE